MAIIEETRRQVDAEIKMLKQTPRISDKSKFIEQASLAPSQKLQDTDFSKGKLFYVSDLFLDSSFLNRSQNDEEVVNRLMQDAKRRQEKILPFQVYKNSNSPHLDEKHDKSDRHNQTGD